MNTPIRTNKLIVTLDRTAFFNEYSVFSITTSEKHFKHGATIFDAPLLCNAVKSVYYESGKSFYILISSSDSSISAIKKVISEAEGSKSVSIALLCSTDVKDHIITQLLLNALGSYNLEYLRFNNLTGHLYCFHPKWIQKSKKGEKQTVMKIPCVEIMISSDMYLALNVRTFTSVLLRKSITFGKRKFHEYPQYVIGVGNSLRRKLKDDDDNGFIMRQTDGDKTTIPFLDIQNKEQFDISKMGVLTSVVNVFNSKYEGICHVEFSGTSDYRNEDCSRATISENKTVILDALTSSPVRIVDEIGDEYSGRFCEEIKTALKEYYSVKSTIGKRISNTSLNICVIHNAAYYSGVNDPHGLRQNAVAVQHVTLEDFQGRSKFALSTVIHEILIKKDITNRRITLFDWESLGLSEFVSFGMRAKIQNIDKYFFMKVSPDGSFEFQEQKLDLFESNQYSDCVAIFEDSNDVCGIIKASNGDINIIRNTGWFTIPEIETINELLSAGDNRLRGKARRDELLSSVLDIKSFNDNDARYYFVGAIGEGMRTKINCASNIRRIEPYKDASLMTVQKSITGS